MMRRPFAWLLAIAFGTALGIAVRVLLFVFASLALSGLSLAAGVVLAQCAWADPVYTRAALSSLGDLHFQGIAIAGQPGNILHALQPALFAEPARAHYALLRVVLQPGSALTGRLIAAMIAHAAALGVGLALVARGARRRSVTLLLIGLAIQAQAALSILSTQPTLRELESTGVSFALNALLPWFWQRGLAVTDHLARAPQPLLAAGLAGLALLVGYCPAAVLAVARRRAQVASLASAIALMLTTAACAGALQNVPSAPAPMVLQLQRAPTPAPAPTASTLVRPAFTAPLGSDRWFDAPALEPARGPSKVEVRGSNGHFQLLVNGEPLVIKGMGLNTQYTRFMSREERAARLESDMTALQQLGVNTVLGWDPNEFDQTLLDAAARHNIGVVMPFELDPNLNYSDPELRQQLREQVIAWVMHYRDDPAVRMWGLGNEVLHKMVHPAWVGPQDPARNVNAEAFSDWLIETADAIHALDPNHPVTYRSAEDAFVPWVVDALKRHPSGPRTWFVWGTNCYQNYLGKILENWRDSGLDIAIWVSEFAPGTVAVPDRPDGFATMWGYIREHPDWVLGGAVYAWTRNGPEGVDRNFGLTDDGVPVDGRSLDELRALFHQA